MLNEILRLSCWVLADRRKRWQGSRYSVTYNEQSAMWKQWRNEEPEDNPLGLVNMTAGQQVLRQPIGSSCRANADVQVQELAPVSECQLQTR